MMMKRIIQVIGLLFGGVLGAQVHRLDEHGAIWTDATYGMMQQSGSYYINVGIGALCGLAAATVLAGPFMRWMQQGAERAAAMPTGELMSGAGGLLAGSHFRHYCSRLFPDFAEQECSFPL